LTIPASSCECERLFSELRISLSLVVAKQREKLLGGLDSFIKVSKCIEVAILISTTRSYHSISLFVLLNIYCYVGRPRLI
jgi:hypothetical protein